MQLSSITPLILTFNEEVNLAASLSAIAWANRVVVIDSGSTDGTVALARSFPNVEVLHRDFDNHTNQWNYGLDQVRGGWVLTLDADYICPETLPDELLGLAETPQIYFANFRYCVMGKPLRSTLYPPRAVLFPTAACRYIPDGHTQLLDVGNQTQGFLRSTILHNDLKPLQAWLSSQTKYARLEAAKLLEQDKLGWKDRIRKTIFLAPMLTFVYCLFCKGLLLDGWKGVYYSIQRVYAELLLSLHLLDNKVRSTRTTK